MALRCLTTGGDYIGSGIAPKLIDKLKGPAFIMAFSTKGRLAPLLESIPVQVIESLCLVRGDVPTRQRKVDGFAMDGSGAALSTLPGGCLRIN